MNAGLYKPLCRDELFFFFVLDLSITQLLIVIMALFYNQF